MENSIKKDISVVMMGATGAVGGEALRILLTFSNIHCLSLFGRKEVPNISKPTVHQYGIDIFDPDTYISFLPKHDTAICTLGVGEPSKISKEEFVKIDKLAVLDFAKACKDAGVRHFQLLASVGVNAKSSVFYLKTKGELVEELKALKFERLSIFKPSMILTPQNRYGFSQAIILKIWPLLKPILILGLRKYRGVKVSVLGAAMAKNIQLEKIGFEALEWDDFQKLSQ